MCGSFRLLSALQVDIYNHYSGKGFLICYAESY